jgi:hypothetical protein
VPIDEVELWVENYYQRMELDQDSVDAVREHVGNDLRTPKPTLIATRLRNAVTQRQRIHEHAHA